MATHDPGNGTGPGTGRDSAYHSLLARHEAARLRRQLLTPGRAPEQAPEAAPVGASPEEPYDGAADQRTILASLDLVTPFEGLIARLYEALFTQHPSLRSLFPASMEFQQAHLAQAFRFLIDHLDRPEQITRRFTQLGRNHRKLGVRPAQYAAFEAALCEALRVRAGLRWSEELEAAWVRMLRAGTGAMIAGAESALREPPCWRAKVTAHQRLAPDLAILRVRPNETFRHLPGQHTTVESALLPHAWRPYYLASAPGQEELELHVRAAGPGGVSEALVCRTAPGDEIRLGPPKGNLTLEGPAGDGELLLVAWDTGWAAMRALLHRMDEQHQLGHVGTVRLLLAADAPAGPYGAEEATGLAHSRPWLTVDPLTPTTDPCTHLARAATSPHAPRPTRAILAGPPPMTHTLTAALTAAGLPHDRLHHDTDFTPTPPPTHTNPALRLAG